MKYKDKKENTDKGVLDICKELYSDLFYSASKNILTHKIKTYISNMNVTSRLKSCESNLCESKINMNECNQVVKELESIKSSHLDVLTADFYQEFRS